MQTFLKLFLEWWKYCVLFAIGIVLVLGIRAALESRDVRVALKATSKAEKRVRAEVDAERKQNAEKAAADKAALEKERPKNAQQAIKVITKYIPLSAPLPDLRSQSVTSSLLDAPSVTFSQQQLVETAEFAIKCRQCDVDRSNYIADVSLLEKKVESLERERDAAVRAVNGGTKWVRFKKAAKHIGIGVAVGIAVGAAAKR